MAPTWGGPGLFLLFQGNLQNRTGLKSPPFDCFSVLYDFFPKFFNVKKDIPLEFFDILQQNVC